MVACAQRVLRGGIGLPLLRISNGIAAICASEFLLAASLRSDVSGLSPSVLIAAAKRRCEISGSVLILPFVLWVYCERATVLPGKFSLGVASVSGMDSPSSGLMFR